MIDMRIPGQMAEGELLIERLAAMAPEGSSVAGTGSVYSRSSFVWDTIVDRFLASRTFDLGSVT
jgi:hypothetical protein